MSIERRRKAAQTALKRRMGMLPDQAEELNRQIAGLDDWRVHCLSCDTTIVGTPTMIEKHAEECRGA
jgi:hypothetical protein